MFAAQLPRATPPEAVVLLARLYNLRDYVDDRAGLAAVVARVSADPQQNQLVRDEAQYYLARIAVHENDFDRASALLDALGFIRQWTVIGPFAAPDGLDAQLGPERGFTAETTLTDSAGTIRQWRKFPGSGPQPWMDAADLLSRAAVGVAYASAAVYTDEAQTVALRFSAESALAVFVNGRRVYVSQQQDVLAFDQHAVAVELQPGWNAVVVKLARTAQGSWRFGLRISGLAGRGIVLKTAADQPATAKTATHSDAVAQDVLDMAQAAVDIDPASAARVETLGRLEHERARGNEAEHLEAAARRVPAAERWLAVAETCGEGPCRFAALRSALQSEPDNHFARLALANYYFGRGQLEKARDLLREAVRLAPADFVLRNTLADVYVAVGLNSLALEESRKLEAEFPSPLWLKRKLAARYTDFGMLDCAAALLESAQRANADGPEERTLLVNVYRRRHDRRGLRALYDQMMRLNPADAGALAELAILENGAGEFGAAERMMRAATEIAPDDADLRQQFANLLARAGNRVEAERQLARALQANPHLENARQRLRNGAQTSAGDADSESEYLADAATLASGAHRHPPQAAVNVVQLADVRVERVFESGLSAVHVQQVFYIATEQAAREYSTRSVQYTPGSQDLRLLHARVHKPDGRVLDGDEAGDSGTTDTTVSMYYDVRARTIRFPAVEKRDVIELDYRLAPTSPANPYGDYFGELVVFRSALQQTLQRFVLITPARRRFNMVEARMAPAVVTERDGERIYRWEARNSAPLPNEPRGPALTDVAPYVHVSTFGSWRDVGRWYAQLVQPQFALDTALREAATGLLRSGMTEREKISAMHEFVLRNTHYVALEFGIYSYKPYPASQTFARRFGDCKDKATLMIALLRQAGVEADIALVRTRRLGDIDPQATSIALFNHAIVYVPKYDLWLDGTAEYAGSRELPLEDQGAMALVVSPDGRASLRRIPITDPGDNVTRRTVRAQVRSDGQIDFDGTAYTRGEDAPGLRREYEVAERQRDSFRERLAEIFPSIRVEDVRVDGATDLERDVNVEFRGALDTFAGHHTLSLAASWMQRSYVQTLAPLASRTQDLLLPAPWTTEEELHFQLPAGASVTSMPADTKLETPFGSASLKYERRGSEVVVRTSVQFRKLRVSPADYADFRDFCQRVERAFRSEIKVALRG